jgi:hypothetical protein
VSGRLNDEGMDEGRTGGCVRSGWVKRSLPVGAHHSPEAALWKESSALP